MPQKQIRRYIAIDLKSFYASVECQEMCIRDRAYPYFDYEMEYRTDQPPGDVVGNWVPSIVWRSKRENQMVGVY